jgi:LysM repeat protein
MAGYLKQVAPKSGAIVHFQYDPEQCEPTGGVGGWTEVPRPHQVNGSEWASTPLLKLTVGPLMLDGYVAGKSIEPTLAQYYAWGQASKNNANPPVLQLGYGIYSKLRWVIQDIRVTDTLRRSDGQRVQAKVSIDLLEYQGLTVSRTAADSVRSQIITANTASGQTHKNPTVSTYTVVKGDTLSKIAAHKLGKASRWKEIATLNHIKDPYHLKVGLKLKLPAK